MFKESQLSILKHIGTKREGLVPIYQSWLRTHFLATVRYNTIPSLCERYLDTLGLLGETP